MIKLALPAGNVRSPLASALEASDLKVTGYGEGSRAYRLDVEGLDGAAARVFREKDIPVQIALGNYDLGICGLAWVREMQARFPGQPVVALRDMGLGSCGIYAAGAQGSCQSMSDLAALARPRIASDYPNLAEAFAAALRLRAYRVQAVWGAAEAYPPEDADVAVVAAEDEGALRAHGLVPLFRLIDSSAWLIANAESLARKDLSPLLGRLIGRAPRGAAEGTPRLPPPLPAGGRPGATAARQPEAALPGRRALRLAVPDGHQQQHAVAALRAAGIQLKGYDASECARRPGSPIEGLEVKAIRPHDMPQLVATGEMDLAITGRDCLMEHLCRFPSSPVAEVVDLQRGQFNLSAVVSEELPAGSIGEALEGWRAEGRSVLRVAAELPALADYYARSRHFWRYQVIPIAGASEGFVPEDAELLIEGTETGQTLAQNRLKAIDLLFRSTTCVIARKEAALQGRRRELFQELVSALRTAGTAEPV